MRSIHRMKWKMTWDSQQKKIEINSSTRNTIYIVLLFFPSFLIMDMYYILGSYQNLIAEPTAVAIPISQSTCYIRW